MKKRIIGAIYVLAWFGGGLFLCSGKFFTPIVFGWLVLAFAELYVGKRFFFAGGHVGNPAYEECLPFAQAILALAMCCCILCEDYRIIALAVIACFVSDTCGLLVGKLLGEHNKVSALKNISPNKSVAGFIGAIIVSAPINYFVAVLLGLHESVPVPSLVAFAAMSGAFAAGGDLLGSATKRYLGVKDSGKDLAKFPIIKYLEKPLLGGHGGYYDRMDSVCIEIVVAWIMLGLKASP